MAAREEDANLEEEQEDATLVHNETGEQEMFDAQDDTDSATEKKGRSLFQKMAHMMQLLVAFLLYCYVLVVIVLRYIFPASLAPLLQHWAGRVAPQPERNGSNNTEAYNLAVTLGSNSALLALFVLQHTVMAHINLNGVLGRYNMAAHVRALYVFTTCLVTDVIYRLWQPLSDYQLWHCGSDYTIVLIALSILHLLAWVSIACSVFALDYLELLGIKQLYYSYKGFYDPMAYKSMEQRELLRNMRHPVFLAPLAILLFVPTMTYDRLLIAVLTPLYLAWGSRLTYLDADYVVYQHHQKGVHLETSFKED